MDHLSLMPQGLRSPSQGTLVKSSFKAKPISQLKIDPKVLTTMVKNFPAQKSLNVQTQIDSGQFDPEQGKEQFTPLEQQAIDNALMTGDFSSLTPKLKAYIDFQVAARQAELEAQENALEAQAAEEKQKQENARIERDKRIAKTKQTQMVLNLMLTAAGAGVLYYLAFRR